MRPEEYGHTWNFSTIWLTPSSCARNGHLPRKRHESGRGRKSALPVTSQSPPTSPFTARRSPSRISPCGRFLRLPPLVPHRRGCNVELVSCEMWSAYKMKAKNLSPEPSRPEGRQGRLGTESAGHHRYLRERRRDRLRRAQVGPGSKRRPRVGQREAEKQRLRLLTHRCGSRQSCLDIRQSLSRLPMKSIDGIARRKNPTGCHENDHRYWLGRI